MEPTPPPHDTPLPGREGDGSNSAIPLNLSSSLPIQSVKNKSSESPPEPESKRLHTNEELHDLYVGNKTAITTAKKRKLVDLYAYLIGGKVEECEKLTKDHLLDLIYDLVRLAGLFKSHLD